MVEYPITFEECPNCGSKRKMAQEVIDEQIEEGRAGEGTQAWLFTHQSIIADMTRRHIQMPMVLTFYDVCVDCGTAYCIRAEKTMATPKIGKGPRLSAN